MGQYTEPFLVCQPIGKPQARAPHQSSVRLRRARRDGVCHPLPLMLVPAE